MEFIADLQMIPMLRGGRLPVESLSAVEKHLLGLVDGRRSVQELGFECGFDGQMAGRMVGKLLMAGILEESRLSKSSADSIEIVDEPPVRTSEVESEKHKRGDETSQSVTEDAVVDLHGKLDGLNHYELLQVTPVASRTEIRRAYFSLSKKFHPDTRYLHSSAELKNKLSRIFDKLTAAYETLSSKSKRSAYDASISDTIEMWKLEHAVKQSAETSAQQSEKNIKQASVRPDRDDSQAREPRAEVQRTSGGDRIQPQKPSSSSYRRMPVQDDVSVGVGARVSRIPVTRSSYTSELSTPSSMPPGDSREYKGEVASGNDTTGVVRQSRPSISAQGSLSPEEREARRQQWKQDRLKKAMRHGSISPDARRMTASEQAASEVQLIDKARMAMEQHEFEMAIECIQEVLLRDGENRLASQLLRKAQSGKIKSDINELIRKGRFEQSRGNSSAALELYETAYKLDISDMEAKFHIAAILLEMRRDLRRAIKLCQEVIGSGGRKSQYFTTLADLYDLAGDRARAVEAMQYAVNLAPEDRELKKRLRVMTRK